jgi:hypothetical protein
MCVRKTVVTAGTCLIFAIVPFIAGFSPAVPSPAAGSTFQNVLPDTFVVLVVGK